MLETGEDGRSGQEYRGIVYITFPLKLEDNRLEVELDSTGLCFTWERLQTDGCVNLT